VSRTLVDGAPVVGSPGPLTSEPFLAFEINPSLTLSLSSFACGGNLPCRHCGSKTGSPQAETL
jgi:hypothetical protein